jgi:hypothetical protein
MVSEHVGAGSTNKEEAGGIGLSQRKYTFDLLQDTRFLESKPVDKAMDPNQKVMINQGEPLEHPKMHIRMVAKLNYLTTSPDITFAGSLLIGSN